MNPNLTLLGQAITFAIFVWFTMKFVWPPVMKALAERQKKIAEGLEAAERTVREFELARHKAADILREAKGQASHIIEQAHQHSARIIDEGKARAREEGDRLIALAKTEIEQEIIKAKQQLRQQVAAIAMQGAEKILGHKIDKAANQDLLGSLIDEI